jgi:DNA-binding NtrC family response regulator
MARVLVVDDEAAVSRFVCEVLRHVGHVAVAVEDGDAAAACVRAEPFGLALVDVKLPGPNGIAVLSAIRAVQPELGAIVITAFPDYAVSVEQTALAGEFSYLRKPFTAADLLRAVDLVMRSPRARPSMGSKDETLPAAGETFEGLVGSSPAMRALFGWMERVAPTHEPVLLQGETGTGKELVARAIHRLSGRRTFVALNCAAAGPEGLLEKELFGSERGAYTNARERSTGWFEAAHRGTLFLDEIGELCPAGQAKLLRVLEEHRFTRLGGRSVITVDVRIVAASNCDLAARAGSSFRLDLFHRLDAFSTTLPPLRERAGDVRLLVRHFLPLLSRELGLPTPRITDSALERLAVYAWPGNIRELQQVLKKACVCDVDRTIETDDLPDQALRGVPDHRTVLDSTSDGTLAEVVGQVTAAVERNAIERALARHSSLAAAARALGIDQKTLYRKRLQHGLRD